MSHRSDRGSAPTVTASEILMELHKFHDIYGRWPTPAELMAEFNHKEHVVDKIRWLVQNGDVERVGYTLLPLGLPPAGPVKVEHWTREQLEAHLAETGGDKSVRDRNRNAAVGSAAGRPV